MNIPNRTPVIPPPDDENHFVNRPPVQTRAARAVAWVNLILGNIFAARTSIAISMFLCAPLLNNGSLFALLVAALIIFAVWSIVIDFINGNVAIVNDIILGIAAYWPDPFGAKDFFNELDASCRNKTDLRQLLAMMPIPPMFNYATAESRMDLNASPRLKRTTSALIRIPVYLLCSIRVISALISSAFWYLEGTIIIFIILYGFYMRAHNTQR